MGIAVIGAVFVDIKGYPLAQYIPKGRNAGKVVQVHGGVSRNVAEDIANVELKPVFVSLVDESGIGSDVLDKLVQHKVDVSHIRRTKDGLGTWLAVFDNNGDVVASISKRPDLEEITRIMEEEGDDIISQADSVVVEIDMEPHILKIIFRLAEKYHKEVYAVVSNISLAMERRDLFRRTSCMVCNEQEAGILFSDDFSGMDPQELSRSILWHIRHAQIPRMVVTLGERGAVYAQMPGVSGYCPAQNVHVIDTTGAGDAFFSGIAIGLTYHKSLAEACQIGTRLATAVIMTRENVTPRFLPEEFGLDVNQT